MDRELLEFFNRPVLERGDLIWKLGKFLPTGFRFIGIPGTKFGVSYYVVRGDEDATTRERLVNLVR